MWVLTARHINGTSFELPGVGTFTVAGNYTHPNADIRLIKLSSPVPSWSPIFYEDISKGGTALLSEKVTIVGYGDQATVRPDGGGYVYQGKDGNRHKTYNMIDGTTSIRFSESQTPWLCYFVENDNPQTATGLYGPWGWIPGEGGLASGDSGGGFFIKRNGKLFLVGVNSARGAAPNGGTVWDYGGVSFATCLSVPTVRAWIEGTMAGRLRSRS